MTTLALDVLSDPNSNPLDYANAVDIVRDEVLRKAFHQEAFSHVGIHAVAAATDYELLLKPTVEALRESGHLVAVSCLWPVSKVLLESKVDTTSISMAMSEKYASKMPLLLVMAQAIGTATELQSILAHVLFEMRENNYERIIVLSLASHVDAEMHLKGMLPDRYRESFVFLDSRKDHELSLEGVLLPGIGGTSAYRAGFNSQEEARSFVPEIFRSKYDFEKRPKPGFRI